MEFRRSSGILLHPTSLPGHYGIGSFNQAAYEWVDFLQQTHQTLWQVLPLGPTGFGDSPYQSFSTFAGNPYLISLETMVEEGLLDRNVLDAAPDFPRDHVDFGAVYRWKIPVLRAAADDFARRATPSQQEEYAAFRAQEAGWLDDYALFMALKDVHKGTPWNQWSMALRGREPEAIATARATYVDAIGQHTYMQWHFFKQWGKLKAYANERGIRIMGDIPIFVAMDSSDAWANPGEFFLDDAYQPTIVAGVPPDYFSRTGQLWGNPLYRWQRMQNNGYSWWLGRILAALQLYDMIRIDHFRGFAGYWAVPAGEETAINGSWRPGPGADFFRAVQAELGDLPIIAEDLGEITPDVIELREAFQLPGMKILQFAFASDATDKFLPHNFASNAVVYPGTHDNDTAWGWYLESSTTVEQDHFRRYFRTDGHDVAWTMIEACLASVATMALFTLQDVLNLGAEARMNLPGQAEGNWAWRYLPEQLTGHVGDRLSEATLLYGRDPDLYDAATAGVGGQQYQSHVEYMNDLAQAEAEETI